MNQNRRDMLRISAVLGMAFTAGLLKASDVFAADWNQTAFDAKSLDDVVKALGGDKFAVSGDVSITGPDIAENGAVVPVSVSSKVPNTEYMAILVEKNPSAMSAGFNIPAGTDAAISTRVKMGATSNVHALVKADGKWLVATKEIKVTLGGCGG
ncbi:MAG TPA: thiosulfate oxidation carrier protein SoxY [Noviherbaspirillum sp.]|uniref:thiosulfate oxidation carrier protein SoxY n=1 Tax=Noviherbaspirillum sp. TaxID=1926288 RepID=UPI002B49F675|nr:thiosulfate oxidation carrier protein SoxY [Noviherbaspirillum sp.]HJV85290.1 thiosulfate oxidation carrier protein SoxY [Noviherbaspirillum sp.]